MLSLGGRFGTSSHRTLAPGATRRTVDLDSRLSEVRRRLVAQETLATALESTVRGPRLSSALTGGSSVLAAGDVLQWQTLISDRLLSVGATLHIGTSSYRVGVVDPLSITITETFSLHPTGSKIFVTNLDRLRTLATAVGGGVQIPTEISVSIELMGASLQAALGMNGDRVSFFRGSGVTDWWKNWATYYEVKPSRPFDQYMIRAFHKDAIFRQ